MDEASGMPSIHNHNAMGLQRPEPEPVTTQVGPKVERTHETAPKPPAMSGPLTRFNQTLQRKMGQTSSTQELLGGSLSPRKSVERALRDQYGRGCVRRVAKHKGRDIYDTIEAHHGPVIILGVTGGPEFVFERLHDGSWQGYEANGNKPLPRGVGPKDKVVEQYKRHHGLIYSLFAVEGWEGESRLTSSSEALLLDPHREGTAEDWPVPPPETESRHRRREAEDAEDVSTSAALRESGGGRRLHKGLRLNTVLVDDDSQHHTPHRAHGGEGDNDSIVSHPSITSRSSSSLSGGRHEDQDVPGWDQVDEQVSIIDESTPVSPIEPQP